MNQRLRYINARMVHKTPMDLYDRACPSEVAYASGHLLAKDVQEAFKYCRNLTDQELDDLVCYLQNERYIAPIFTATKVKVEIVYKCPTTSIGRSQDGSVSRASCGALHKTKGEITVVTRDLSPEQLYNNITRIPLEQDRGVKISQKITDLLQRNGFKKVDYVLYMKKGELHMRKKKATDVLVRPECKNPIGPY